MKSTTALAKAAWVSILGSIGQGTFGADGPPNFAVGSNGAPIAAAQSNLFEITGFKAKVTGRILVIAMMSNTVSNVDDSVNYQTTVDGTPVPGAPLGGFANAPTGHVQPLADGTIFWIQSVLVGGVHSYGILGTNATGGHTVATGTGAATVAIYELP
jgi:hypothetical protein